MRIIQPSADVLIVSETGTGFRTAGIGTACLGAAFLVAGLRTSGTPMLVVGAATLAIGGLLVLLPLVTTISFNRVQGRFVVDRRRLWSSEEQRDEFPLRDVAAVQLDESKSDDGSTWRVVVRMADGRTIPFTSYYSSGVDAKLDLAQRIGSFLDVGSATQTFGGQSSPHAIVRESRGATMFVALLFVVLGVVFASLGGSMVIRETRRLSDWQPVQATVLSTYVDTRSDSDGNTYLPVVTYRYSVNSQPYTSSQTMPIKESRSGGWAHRVIARFSRGGTYTAWYNPADPSEAFIVRSHSIVAPMFAVIGAFAIVAGVAVGVSARRRQDL